MATIQSTKPGEIAGTSVLTGRTPSYRLVLKVDPQTGQYKYEYEVDANPKAVDAVTPPPQAASTKVADPVKDIKKETTPVQTFEQTQQMLSGTAREPSGRGPLDQRESNFKTDDRNFGQMALDSQSARGRNLVLGAINPAFGALGAIKSEDDKRRLKELGISTPIAREQIADVYGKAIADGKTPQEALREATLSGGVALTDQAFKDAGVPELSINKQLEDFKTGKRTGPSFDDSAVGKSTFDQTVDSLGGVRDIRRPDALDMGAATDATKNVIGSTIDDQIRELENELVGKTGKTRTRLNQQLNSLKEQKEELDIPTKVFTGTPKQQQQKKGPFDLVTRESLGERLSTQATQDAEIQDVTEQLRDLGLQFRGQSIDVAKFEIDNRKAKNALTAQGLLHTGQTFTEAQAEVKADITKKAVAAERAKKELAAKQAREAAAREAAAAARMVDRNNPVSNVARTNEVADKNGNVVTYTDRVTGQQKAVNWSGGSGYNVSPAKGARLTRSEVRQRKAQIDRQKERKQPGGRDRQRQRDRREGRRARGGQGGTNRGTSRF